MNGIEESHHNETLTTLTIGKYGEISTELRKELGGPISPEKDYSEYEKELDEDNMKRVNRALSNVVNFLEVVSINVKNHVIDEDICYDYFHTIMVDYYLWSKPYIIERRRNLNDDRLFIEFEYIAERWKKRREDEDESIKNTILLPKKEKL